MKFAAHVNTAEWERSPNNPEIVITTVTADGGADGETVEQFPIDPAGPVVTLEARGYEVDPTVYDVEPGYYIHDVTKAEGTEAE